MYTAERGISLVEVVVFIVVVGVALAGLFAAFSTSVRGSADPLARKQALAVAEGLLHEILLQPFTFCDPDDANAREATSAAGCASLPESIGPEGGETRGSLATPFDNVNDYHGYAVTGVRDVTDPSGATVVPGLESYTVAVAVTPAAVTGAAAGEALQVDVRVQGPGAADVTLTAYRFRHAPNAVP